MRKSAEKKKGKADMLHWLAGIWTRSLLFDVPSVYVQWSMQSRTTGHLVGQCRKTHVPQPSRISRH